MSGINTDLGSQQMLNTDNPWLNFISNLVQKLDFEKSQTAVNIFFHSSQPSLQPWGLSGNNLTYLSSNNLITQINKNSK